MNRSTRPEPGSWTNSAPAREAEPPDDVLEQSPIRLLAGPLHDEVTAELLEAAELALARLGGIRAFRCSREEDRDQDRQPEEDEQRGHVLRPFDHEGPVRQQEGEIEGEEPDDRRRDAGTDAPERCRDDDNHHESEPHRRGPQGVAEGHQDQGEPDRPDERDDVPCHPPHGAGGFTHPPDDVGNAHDTRIGTPDPPPRRRTSLTKTSIGIPNGRSARTYGFLIPPG